MVLLLHSGANFCAHPIINSRYHPVIVHQWQHQGYQQSHGAWRFMDIIQVI